MGGWVDGWMDEQVSGWMDDHIHRSSCCPARKSSMLHNQPPYLSKEPFS